MNGILKRLESVFIEKTKYLYPKNFYRNGTNARHVFDDFELLVEEHFKINSEPDHPCRVTLTKALSLMENNSPNIVETGSSAWGANSSLLFDSYVNSFGGRFSSVDIRAEPMWRCSRLCSPSSRFFCADSVDFLKEYTKDVVNIDLVYLDSWDVNWADPFPSALHGLKEFLVVYGVLREAGGLLLIDDTPCDAAAIERVQPKHTDNFRLFEKTYGFTPGKGALVNKILSSDPKATLVAHDYQVLWSF